MSQAAELLNLFSELDPDSREVLLEVARRSLLGAKRYGPLNLEKDRRDFQRELLEEQIDAVWYGAVLSVRASRKAPVKK